ncbi:hypothetical protein FACS189472_04670 [Alphaproteobacteria bacterium]|nr:hypothetical protein FACS189472_04670 [Alphaproteobacteria bacterium]
MRKQPKGWEPRRTPQPRSKSTDTSTELWTAKNRRPAYTEPIETTYINQSMFVLPAPLIREVLKSDPANPSDALANDLPRLNAIVKYVGTTQDRLKRWQVDCSDELRRSLVRFINLRTKSATVDNNNKGEYIERLQDIFGHAEKEDIEFKIQRGIIKNPSTPLYKDTLENILKPPTNSPWARLMRDPRTVKSIWDKVRRALQYGRNSLMFVFATEADKRAIVEVQNTSIAATAESAAKALQLLENLYTRMDQMGYILDLAKGLVKNNGSFDRAPDVAHNALTDLRERAIKCASGDHFSEEELSAFAAALNNAFANYSGRKVLAITDSNPLDGDMMQSLPETLGMHSTAIDTLTRLVQTDREAATLVYNFLSLPDTPRTSGYNISYHIEPKPRNMNNIDVVVHEISVDLLLRRLL